MERRWSQTCFSSAQCQDQGQWTQMETQEVPSDHQERHFYSEGD